MFFDSTLPPGLSALPYQDGIYASYPWYHVDDLLFSGSLFLNLICVYMCTKKNLVGAMGGTKTDIEEGSQKRFDLFCSRNSVSGDYKVLQIYINRKMI